MTFLALESRDDLPRVPYITALDVYVGMCFLFVFASIVQYAGVHNFTKYGMAEKQEGFPTSDSNDDEDENEESYQHTERTNETKTLVKDGFCVICFQCFRTFLTCLLHSRNNKFKRHVRNSLGLNSVSKIDKASRLLFPLAFTTLNIVYWVSYLSH